MKLNGKEEEEEEEEDGRGGGREEVEKEEEEKTKKEEKSGMTISNAPNLVRSPKHIHTLNHEKRSTCTKEVG